jgi:hypothetical protein
LYLLVIAATVPSGKPRRRPIIKLKNVALQPQILVLHPLFESPQSRRAAVLPGHFVN